MSDNPPEVEMRDGSWKWVAAGLILGLVLLGRVSPRDQPWDEPATTGGGTYGGNYSDAQAPRYEPGSYGAFWENEAAAQRGEPARASPGIRPETDETQRLRDAVERLKAENERLRQRP